MAAPDENTLPSGATPPKGVPQFTAPPSVRAIALVVLAIVFGFLLVTIVNSDSGDDKDASATQTTAVTTTTAAPSGNNDEEESTTTTTVAIDGVRDPAEVAVLVLNGSNIGGVAGTVSEELGTVGYETLTPGNDSEKDNGTLVYYKSGFKNDADQLATNVVPGILKDLQISQSVKAASFPSSTPTGWDQVDLVSANVVIVIGNAGNSSSN